MAFKKWHKSPSRNPPYITWSKEEMEIIGWGLTHAKIGVGIIPDWKNDMSKWKVHININGNIHEDPNTYEDEKVHEKVNEYYKYYYDKYNK